MLLLAAFLSWGWPRERTIWISPNQGVPVGLVARRLNTCCHSMEPAIHGGELSWWEPYRPGMELHEGEIADDGKVAHRIVALTKTGVRLSGDANANSDPWESRDNLKFILRYIVRQ